MMTDLKVPPSKAAKPVQRLNIMTKPIGSVCNIDCTYCYYLSKARLLDHKKGEESRFSLEMLEHYIQSYIEQQNFPEIVFHWQGGEPTLLGVKFFRDVVRLQKKYCPPGVKIENNLQTNGTLLNDEWGKFLHKNDFLVGLSLDGPELIHNAHRTNRSGKGTFKQTMKGVDILHKYKVNFATLTCINSVSGASPLQVYRFLRDVVRSPQMQFIPIVEPKSFRDTAPQRWPTDQQVFQGMPEAEPNHPHSIVESWSVSAKQWGTFLISVFDEWFSHDLGKVHVPYFEAWIESWMGRVNPLCTLGPMCGKGLAIEHNGDVFACDHYVYPEFKLGNINSKTLEEMQFSPEQEQFGHAKEGTLPTQCRQCDYQFACFGECPKNRFLKTLDGEPGLNYLCAGWKRFYQHADPYFATIVSSMGYPVHKKLNSDAMKIQFR
ncbi:anaerobic sulfatase maturase [Vibrio sp. FNV 38]|nr:anaerobic sulfatase maturase [Vibrio sp. FNV 38]